MTTVEKIKAKILDLAIRGKLVPQDPNDEPASVLLERIKAEKAELVKAKKIKKDKNPSEIIIGSDGVPYEKFADGTSKDLSDEIPFDLPQGWAWARLGMVVSILNGDRGKNYPSKQSLDREGNIPFISAVNIDDGDLIRSGLLYLSKERFDRLRAGKLKHNDIVLCIRGSIGKFCVYPETIGAIASSLVILRNDLGIDVNYISSYIRSSLFNSEVRKFDNGTAQPNLAATDVAKLLIPLPPLAEQKRIVTKTEELIAYAKSISESTYRITKTAQRLDKKILDLAIRGRLVPQDPNDEPASELVKRIEAAKNKKTGSKKSRAAASHKPTYEIEPPFDIPESWEWVRLGEVFNHNTGKALNRNNAEGVLRKYITTSNVHWDEFKLDELKQMPFTDEELNKCTVRKGDLLVCEGGDIGRAAIWNFNKEVCIQNHLHRLRAYSEVCVPYFCFVLRLYKATNRLQGKGIGLQGFSSGMLHNLIIPLPPLAEQKRIVSKIEELRAMTRALTT